MQNLTSEIIINLGGNLQQRARQYSGAMARFSQSNSVMARSMRGSMAMANSGLSALESRYTALIATVAGGAMANRLVDQDRRMSRLAVAADITKKEADELYKKIEDISRSDGIRIDPTETLAGIEVIMEKIGDLDYATKNIKNIAIVAQATGANGEDVGAVLVQLKKMGIETQEDVMKAMDILNTQGKSGSFTLASMASSGEEIFAAYAATGRRGLEAITELGAAMQVIRGGTGSDEKAVTSYAGLMRDLTNPDRVKKLKDLAGIDVFDTEKLKQGVEVMRPLPELMQELITKANASTKFSLSQALGSLNLTDEAKKALNPLIGELAGTGKITAFDDFMTTVADGNVTISDAAKVADDYQGTLQTVGTALNQLANRELAKPMSELAGVIKSLTSEDIDRWLEIGKNITYTVGAIIAARKAWSAAKGIKGMFGRRGGGGANGAGAAGLGVQPVFVTNWPVSLGGGDLSGNSNNRNSRNNNRSNRKKNAANAAVFAAVAAGTYFGMTDDTVPVAGEKRSQDLDEFVMGTPLLSSIYVGAEGVMNAAIGDTDFAHWAKTNTLGDVWNSITGNSDAAPDDHSDFMAALRTQQFNEMNARLMQDFASSIGNMKMRVDVNVNDDGRRASVNVDHNLPGETMVN